MVYSYRGYPTVDNFWDRYHLEYPDIYDRFSLHSISAVDDIQQSLGFTGSIVLDIGSGTGLSAFRIAEYADLVVGIEPFISMRNYAIEKQKRLCINNVKFLQGVGEDLSWFSDREFDCAVSIHSLPIIWEDMGRTERDCQAMVNGCLRVVKNGGYIAIATTTPGWLWDHLVGGMTSFGEPEKKRPTEMLLEPLGFLFRDVRIVIDYGTIEEALATHGFIYGEKAIDYILDKNASKFSWSLRIFYRRV